MNGILRRLALGGIGALALFWATRSGNASAGLGRQDAASDKSCANGTCQTDASGAALSVAAGDCRNFRASGEVFRSEVADPGIAQFVHYSPKEVGIRGLKSGSTTVTIWSAATKKPVTLRVIVTEPADDLANPKLTQAGHEKTDADDAIKQEVDSAKLDDGSMDDESDAKQVDADEADTAHEATLADEVVQKKPASHGGEVGPKEIVQTGVATSVLPIATAAPGLPITADTNYVQQVPAVSLETSSPVIASVGKVVEQQILVKNVGSVAADQVEVRCTVSIDSELVSTEPRATIAGSTMVWRIAKLPAGGQQKMVVRVRPLVAGELSCNTNVTFKSSAAVKVQVTAAKLKLICEGPSSVPVGSDVHVTMTVFNTGTAAAENVRIRQIVPNIQQTGGRAAPAAKPLLLEVGTLEPGESRVLETSSKATMAGVVNIKLVAEAQDGTSANAEHTIKVQEPKLTIATTGPEFRYLNRKATYQITVTNPGDSPVTNLNVMAGLPEGLEFADASHGGAYNAQKRTIAWTPGLLEPNRSIEYSITVIPRTEGEHLQRVVAWADNKLLVKADKVTRVEGTTSLAIEITDVEDPIEIGSETLYQIHITNKGSKSAERVQVVAMIADGLKVTGIESAGTYRMQGQQLVFEPIASMAPQATAVIQIRVKGTKVGSHAIRAMASCPAMPNTIVTEESTAVYGD